jgi:hypothetical protein
LVRSRVASTIEAAARSPAGAAVLTALRSALLRVALAVGGADPSLSESNVASLFRLSGSAIAIQRLYDGGLTLPSRLPWPRARTLVATLLDSLSATRTTDRTTDLGARLETALSAPTPTLDAATQADVTELVQAVETAMNARLGGGAGSSSVSVRTVSPPPPSEQSLPVTVAVEIPSAAEASASFGANVRRLAEARLMYWLSAGEAAQLNEALMDALMVFQTSRQEAKQLVETSFAAALLHPGAAQVWACVVEALDAEAITLAMFVSAVVDSAYAVASATFARAVV